MVRQISFFLSLWTAGYAGGRDEDMREHLESLSRLLRENGENHWAVMVEDAMQGSQAGLDAFPRLTNCGVDLALLPMVRGAGNAPKAAEESNGFLFNSEKNRCEPAT
jgi:hypothetical protein